MVAEDLVVVELREDGRLRKIMKSKYTFTDKDKEQVKEAVASLERESCGEIVPYFVQSSDQYPEASWYMASLMSAIGLISVALLSYFWALPISLNLLEWLLIILALMVIGYLIPIVFPLSKRWLISKDVQLHRVEQRASLAFLNEKVFETEERIGILLFVSRLEHQVIVLGDKGINEKVKPEEWKEVVGIITESIKAGAIADGLSKAILSCKEMLLKHGFVRKKSDYNELDDSLRIKDQ